MAVLSTETKARVRAFVSLPPPERRRELRERAGLSLSAWAAEVGVSAPTMSRYESGDRHPSGERLLRYSAALVELERATLTVPSAAGNALPFAHGN